MNPARCVHWYRLSLMLIVDGHRVQVLRLRLPRCMLHHQSQV
jgi:hypothetical protein